MEKVVLVAEPRKVIGKQVSALRREGKLPAVVYGQKIDPTPITLDLKETTKILSGLTSSSLINIQIGEVQHTALVRDRQRDYIHNRLIHVDFQVVSQDETIRANVSVEIVGISPAVKDFNGVIVIGLNELAVECLPKDLPERLVIDISTLTRIGTGIYVRNINFGDNVTVLEDSDEMIVMVTSSMEDAGKGTGEIEAEESEPEVIEKGKKELEIDD